MPAQVGHVVTCLGETKPNVFGAQLPYTYIYSLAVVDTRHGGRARRMCWRRSRSWKQIKVIESLTSGSSESEEELLDEEGTCENRRDSRMESEREDEESESVLLRSANAGRTRQGRTVPARLRRRPRCARQAHTCKSPVPSAAAAARTALRARNAALG